MLYVVYNDIITHIMIIIMVHVQYHLYIEMYYIASCKVCIMFRGG